VGSGSPVTLKPVNRYHTKVAPAGPDWHPRNRRLVRRWDRGHRRGGTRVSLRSRAASARRAPPAAWL